MSAESMHNQYYKPIVIENKLYTFSHLEPFVFSFDDPRQKQSIIYSLNVRFTNHCFSQTFDPVHHTETMVVGNGRQKRAFDPERYALSARLPDIVRALSTQRVYQTWERRNYVAYETLAELPAGEVYRVFLTLETAGRESRRRGCNLDLFVESAYPGKRLPGISTVRFTTLCYNILNGIPIRWKR